MRTSVASRARLCVLLLAISALSSSSAMPAYAQASAEPNGYAPLIEQAVYEFNLGNWAEAHALFGRAHALQPNARTLRGLGMTSFELRRYVDAQRELQAALDDTRSSLSKEQRQEVAEIVLRAQRFTGTLRVQVSPEDVLLAVDGQVVSERELLLNVGDHRLDASAPGYRPTTLGFSIESGRTSHLLIALDSQGAVPAVSRPMVDQPPAASPPLEEATHDRVHDGFYLRFGIGVGGGSFAGTLTARDPLADGAGIDGKGVAIPIELSVGATVAPGLVVGLGSLGGMIPAPQQRLLNHGATSEFAGGSVLLSTLGPVVDYYPWPVRGLHAQAGIAYALTVAAKSTDPSAASSDDYSGAGWSAMAGVGWETWIGREWSLGALARMQYGSARLKATTSTDTVKTSFLIPALLATVTYH